ncbi:MAG: GNAT family N-acetyltransferase [Acetobacter sp.]|nr:GNAT family N-acetyltransferase [Bacteroides sp.]MCM1341838.1 GNAT family N-acetyltransferase [Acetobacter sp.]MCM1434004.1 GNAT family N-acetyltransferase [Clostridiales bacterium]
MNRNTGTSKIKCSRILLRKICLFDYFSASKWFTNPNIAIFSLSKKPPTKWEVFRLIFGRFRRYYNKSFYSWAIVYNGRMRGFIELLPLKNSKGSFSVSYKLDCELWGKGISTEALSAVIDYAKTQDIAFLIGCCDKNNIGSKRVMEKAGMKAVGNEKTNKPIKYDDGTVADSLYFKYSFNH